MRQFLSSKNQRERKNLSHNKMIDSDSHSAWDLAKNCYKLKNADRTTLCSFTDYVKAMLAPTSTRPVERDFVVDSGASMHMMSKRVFKL